MNETLFSLFLIGNSFALDLYEGLQEYGEVINVGVDASEIEIPESWENAAQNTAWDKFVFQPSYGDTKHETVAAINELTTVIGTDILTYICAAIPDKNDLLSWKDTSSEPSDNMGATEQSLDALVNEVNLGLIPCAHVAHYCVQQNVVDLDALYTEDDNRLSPLGQQLVADTVFAYITDTYPQDSEFAKEIWAVLYPGDFNHDRTVDTDDFVTWQQGFGTIFTENDYLVWQINFEEQTGRGGSIE